MSVEKCPNCGKSLTGFLSADLVPQSKVDFINKFSAQKETYYCTSCAKPFLTKIAKDFKQQKEDIQNRLKQIISHIPILTSPAPVKWDYDVVDMVSAQTTSGTGFTTELSRSFNDLFGSTSKATNVKILEATKFCQADLRIQCVREGGNAIVSTDIDFNEIGSGSTNMLMVCMAGTAIKVKDLNFFSEERREKIKEIVKLTEKLEAIAENLG